MVLATNNKNKLREIREIFSEYEICSLKDKDISIDVVEDGETFYDNAYKKAYEIYKIVGEAVIADDSGLCINALDGFPGVMTSRFLGSDASDEKRNSALVDRVRDIHDKSARVVCVLVYYNGDEVIVGEGVINGKIVEPRGNNGFGFDPIFELSNGKALAELSLEEKNEISARYLAAIDLKEKLKNNIK